MSTDTMPLEVETRILVDNSLENLGWKLGGKNKNVFLEQPKTIEERKKLGGKRPDYVLYSNDGEPLIVIETKKKGSRIDTALEQGIGYARTLDVPLVFATDGVFCRAFHTKANRPPILNGEEIDELIRETLALRYLDNYEVNTISPKVQYGRKKLIQIFDDANNALRGEGLRAGSDRFGEFANILFLKLVSENETIKRESGIYSKFDLTSCSWDVIKNIPLSTRIDYINNTVCKSINKLYNTEIFTPLEIHDGNILKEIMDKLDPLTLTDIDSDVKGDAFEYFLRASTATQNDLGEYFTPRHIVKTMVRLVNPQIGEKIYDPFCGTGGFLIESFRYIERNMASGNKKLQKILREETIYGNEITNTARIAKMNMILAGDGHSNIHKMDSLANPTYVDKISYDNKGKEIRDENGNVKLSTDSSGLYDIVITNMPYSQRTRYGRLYDLPSTRGDSICVQHCMKAINSVAENGRMALVVPEGFLFRKDLAKTREYLLDRCQLQSVISLPQGVFLPYTGVKTDIIYATKVNQKIKSSEKKKSFWYFDVKNDGYTLDNHRRKLDTPSDLNKYEEYRKLDEEQIDDMQKIGFEIIPFDKVRENSFVLVGSRYRNSIFSATSNYIDIARLGDVANFIRGVSFPKSAQITLPDENSLRIVTTKSAQANGIDFENIVYVDNSYTKDEKLVSQGDILISLANSLDLVGRVTYVDGNYKNLSFGAFMGLIRTDRNKIYPLYLFNILQSKKAKEYFKSIAKTTTNISNLTFDDLGNFNFPLPSLKEQIKIADELDGYQQVITGSKKIINNYVPQLPKFSNYVTVPLSDTNLFEIQSGGTPDCKNIDYWNGDINWITLADLPTENYITNINDSIRKITQKGLDHSNAKLLPVGTVVVSSRATIGRVGIVYTPLATNQGFKNVIIKKAAVILPEFLALLLREKVSEMESLASGATFKEISKSNFGKIELNIPSLEEQKKILLNINEEQKLINPSKKLIKLFTEKIEKRVKEVWGE